MIEVYDAKQSEEGWLELDIRSVDLEGAGKIYIDLDEIEELKARRSAETDALERAKKLLGG